nr:hypothetical protein [uncultured Acetatifactor sp.]
MKWIDGSEINMKQFTGETLSEKLVTELRYYDYDQYLTWADFLQAAAFLIEFDTELSINGIFGFLENSIGHYALNIIQACEIISFDDNHEMAEEVEEQISRLSEQLYLYGDFDIWPLLFKYLDKQIEEL